MTINVDSLEYLDVCARLVDSQEAVFKRLQERTSKFGDSGPAIQAKRYIDSIYKTKEDIPIMIAPTEDGWLTANLSRKITSDRATIIVTAKNAKPLKKDIKILDTPDEEGTIIKFC